MKNIKKNSFILLTITLLVVVWILKDDFDQIIDIILKMDYRFLLLAMSVMAGYWIFKSLGMFYIVREYAPKIKFKTIFKQNMVTQFFNGITPFSTGGQPMEIYMLKKTGINLAKSTNVVLQNFIVYQISLVVYGLFAITMNAQFHLFHSVPILRKLVILGFAINTLVGVGVIFICFSKKFSHMILRCVLRIGYNIKIIKNKKQVQESWEKKLLDFHESAKLFVNHKDIFLKGLIYNILALSCYYSVAFFLLLGMTNNISVSLLTSIVSSAHILIIGSFVPIPGGTGGIEYGFLKFFGNFLTGALLSALLLIWRFVTYYLGMIIGGIIFSFYKGDE